MSQKSFRVGDKVKFTDPDEGLVNGVYTLDRIKGEIYCLSNEHGSELEAFAHELTRVEDKTG